jgi:hypothetical protein
MEQPKTATTPKATEPKTYPVLQSANPTALALYCGDPRFQEAIEQFLEEELGLKKGQYVPLVPPGGAASLSEQLKRSLPKEFKFLSEAVQFYLKQFESISEVVVINHEDCRKYQALQKSLGSIFLRISEAMTDLQRQDLAEMLQTILGLTSRNVGVSRYYAKFSNPEKTQIIFEKQ